MTRLYRGRDPLFARYRLTECVVLTMPAGAWGETRQVRFWDGTLAEVPVQAIVERKPRKIGPGRIGARRPGGASK